MEQRATERGDGRSAPFPPGWGARLAPAAATAVSAGLLALAAPPHDLGGLGWIATAPFFWALLRHPRPARLGFLHGFLTLAFLAPWFAAFTPAGYPLAAALWGLLSAATAALTAGALRRSPAALAPPLLAAGWVLLEWLRAQGPLAFPWGQLGASQYRFLPVLQLLDLTGVFGLSFVMALFSGALAALAAGPASGPRGKPSRRPALLWMLGATALAAAATVRGLWILARPEPPGERVRVAAVQASRSLPVPGAAVLCVSPPGEYAARTREAIRAGAELVVWPETASEEDPCNDPVTRAWLGGLLAGSRAHLLAGSFVLHPPSDRLMNAAVLLDPGGALRGMYAKVRIVPFGEYLPLRPLLQWTERLGMPSRDLQPGAGWRPLEWARGRIGVSICFESAFGDISRAYVQQGATLLAILTSDGWAGRTAAGRQHAAFAPLRAVETRRAVARAAATGISQLIDPYGRPLRSLPMFTRGIAVADLPLRRDRTLYTRLGDWPVALALVLLSAPLLSTAARWRGRGSSKLRKPPSEAHSGGD